MKKHISFISIWLVGSLAVGAILRFHHVGLRPFWLDEANSVNFLKFPIGELWEKIPGAESAPAFIFAIKIWSVFFGDSESAIRSFSAACGLVSILAMYFLGKALFGKKAGLWSAFLFSVNYFSIFHSIQARQYSLVILASILSSYFFRNLFSKNKIADKIFFVLFSVTGVYLHPWFFLLFFAQIVWILIFKKERSKFFSLIYLAIFVLTVPWISTLLKYKNSGVNEWIEVPGHQALFDTFHYFVYESGWVYLCVSVAAIFFLFFEVQKVERPQQASFKISERKNNFKKDGENIFFAAFFLFVPLLSAWSVSQFFPFYVVGRYEAVVLPFFILLVAYFFSHIESRFLIAVAAFVLIVFAWNSAEKEKAQIKSYKYNEKIIAQELLGEIGGRDAIIYTGLSRPPFDYYFPRLGGGPEKFEKFSFPAEMERHGAFQSLKIQMEEKSRIEREAEDLAGKMKEKNFENVWLIYASNNPVAGIILEKIEVGMNCRVFLDLALPQNGPVSPLHFHQILKCNRN